MSLDEEAQSDHKDALFEDKHYNTVLNECRRVLAIHLDSESIIVKLTDDDADKQKA